MPEAAYLVVTSVERSEFLEIRLHVLLIQALEDWLHGLLELRLRGKLDLLGLGDGGGAEELVVGDVHKVLVLLLGGMLAPCPSISTV